MRRLLVWSPLAIVLILATPVVAFAVDGRRPERVARNVVVAGVPVGGFDRAALEQMLGDHEMRLRRRSAIFVVDGHQVELDPADVDLRVDVDAAVSAALAARHDGSFLGDLREWVRSLGEPAAIGVSVTVDETKAREILTRWNRDVLDEPAYDGAIVVDGADIRPEYPRPGTRIDIERALPILREQLARSDRSPAVLPTTTLRPALTPADVDSAVRRARALTDHALHLRSGDVDYDLTPAMLASALVQRRRTDPPRLEVRFDPTRLETLVGPMLPRVETAPVDAAFVFDEEAQRVDVVPSRPGLTIDFERLPGVVEQAVLSGDVAQVPMAAAIEPGFTTEMAEAMLPITKVSEFTTSYPCCQSRVTNIHLLADAIDGAIVWPGETFSINQHAGRRTTAKGYVRAGAIIDGRVQCCDSVINIGGGTSQFATTFYNAVFFGCYEDVEHQPHSLYFSRYPYGREATLGWPKPDVVFRNDSDAIVYIDTSYTPTSVTVAFWGNTGGRICTGKTTGRGRVTTTRTITYPDGTVRRESFTWTYRRPKRKPRPPSTTTSTVPPSTSVPPSTTTTAAGP